MTAAIPTIEPESVTAGDLIQWTRSISDYPAGTWLLTYALVNATDKITITAGASGTDHAVSVSSANSALWKAGLYSWQAYLTSGSDRVTIGSGTIQIKPNFATAAVLDNRSQARRILDAITATIENRASLDQQSYEIQGRKLARTPIADLILLQEKYARIVRTEENAERIAQGKKTKNKLYVRFN